MTDDAKTRVHKAIQDVLSTAPTAEKSRKAIGELTQAMLKVDQATKKGVDADLLGTYRREDEAALRDAGVLATDADYALKALKNIASDEDDFQADAKEITSVQESLTAIRNSLADWVVKGRKVDERAKAEEEKGEKSEKTAHRQWDIQIENFEAIDKATAGNVKSFRGAYERAVAAVKARDRAALAENLQGLSAASAWVEGVATPLAPQLDAFAKKYDVSTFSEEFQHEMAEDRKAVAEIDKRAVAASQEVKKLIAAGEKLAIAPPDAVKVTAKLGFKANFNTRVEKALKLDEGKLAKELEAIAQDAGVKGTGKDFIAKLKKEGLYP